ncbi:MAG: TMEM143 family protein [Gemmataceae bacterium]
MSRPVKDCRHFIPVSGAELLELFRADPTLGDGDRALLGRVADHVSRTHHLAMHARLLELTESYRPFDPDTDSITLRPLRADDKQHRLNDLFSDLNWLLDRAHFRHLGRQEIEPLLRGASEWGIRMRVDFSAFDHVALFVRGDGYETRNLRNWRTLFQDTEVEVPVYRRLVVVLKLRDHPALGPGVNTGHVYLKLFKDIPRDDVDMLLPGARVQMNLLDRGKIGVGVLSGLATIVIKTFNELAHFVTNFAMSDSAALGLVGGLFGYGFKSYSDYQTTRQAYHLSLTRSLYFLNLDSNAGVLARLIGEAEEQQTRTALLAYHTLGHLIGPDGATADELESAMGLFLDRYAQVPLLCQPGEPAALLRALGLVVADGDRLRAVALERAASRAPPESSLRV